jgi:transposase
MMGRRHREQASLFYEFRLDDMIPKDHLLRRIDVFLTSALGDLHEQLEAFYSDIGRPSIDPELLVRMLIVGYCYGIRSERKLCQEVRLHLAYRWFCRLDLNDAVPHHSTFSENRLNRFRESDILRHIFERVVTAANDKFHALEFCDIVCGITGDGNEICVLPVLDGPNSISPPNVFCADRSRRANRLQRRHAVFDHGCELDCFFAVIRPRLLAVGTRCIYPKSDLGAGLERPQCPSQNFWNQWNQL